MATRTWRKSLSDFSEIDTSDVTADLSDLPGFDHIKDIINNEDSLANTDYMNQIDDLPPLITASQLESEIEIVFCSTDNGVNTNTDNLIPITYINTTAIPTTTTTITPTNITITGDLGKEARFVKKMKKKKVNFPKFPCVVCKKAFKDKAAMKAHVLKTHLRPVILCSNCGKRVFQDKLAQHQTSSCSVPRKY